MATQDGEIQLELCIDLAADPIAGSVSLAQGPQRRFSGWIGLVSALESIRAEQSQHPGVRNYPDA